MKKILKKWGNSLVITFSKEEVSINELNEGDILDLDDMIIEKKLKKEVK